MKYSDKQRLRKIYEYAKALTAYIADHKVTKEAVVSDVSLQWLVTTPLYNIGEHVYQLSAEYKKEHDDIPWSMISGLRHRLVHDYDDTNWDIIVEVIFDELPDMLLQMKKHLDIDD